jgi:hypothetical protein
VYVVAMRNLPHPLLEAFDQPDRHASCAARPRTTTAPQALALLNGEASLGEAHALADQLVARHAGEPGLIQAAYRRVLGRPPSAREAAAAAGFLSEESGLVGGPRARAEAVADLCHALMNTAEFLYVE